MNDAKLQLEALFNMAVSGEVQMHSALGTRDESRQTKQFTARIQKMKTICGLNHRILVMKDLVLPFNPFTGESNEYYNETRPFRPILLVSQSIEMIKKICKENNELCDFYKNLLNGEFDAEDNTTYNDYLLFKNANFIKPRITTYDVVSADFNGRAGLPEFKVKYTVDPTQLNSERTYDFDNAPLHHKLAVLFNSICREEWKDKEKDLKNSLTDEQLQTARRQIFSQSPIAFVRPQNLVPFFFYALDEPFPEIKSENFMDVEKDIRFYSYTDKWQTAFEEVKKDDSFDELIDFFEFTVKTPTSGTKTTNGSVYTDDEPNAIYQAMSISVTDARKSISGGSLNGTAYLTMFSPVYDCIKSYFLYCQEEETKPDGKGFEQIMALSNRFRPIESVGDSLLQAAHEIFNEKFADSKYFTESIRKANNDVIVAMDPSRILETAGYEEEDLKEAEKQQQKSLKDLLDVSDDTLDTSFSIEDLGVEIADMDTNSEKGN